MELSPSVPRPGPMTIDRQVWQQNLFLSNFVNTYYQYRDLQRLGSIKSILVVGHGQGLDTVVLRWRDYQVTTFDIDEIFKPDVMGSVHDMAVFDDKQFDAVIVSHVLEHLAVPYLDTALKEIARVSHYALAYFPVAGRHVQFRLVPGLRGYALSIVIDVFNYFQRPDGITPKYCFNQHFWEVGMRGFRVKDLIRRMSPFFYIVDTYRNHDWLPSRNFVLRSKVDK
jgi:hypothetical protein